MLFSKYKKYNNRDKIHIGLNMNVPKPGERRITYADLCSRVILVLLAVYGIVYSFIGSFSLDVETKSIAAFILLFTAIFTFAYFNKKWTKFILPVILAFYLLFCLFSKHDIIQGFIITTNQVFKTFTDHSNWQFLQYETEPASTYHSMEMGTDFVMAVIFAVIGIISTGVIRFKSFFTVFFTALPFIATPLFFTITPPLLPLMMLVCCLTALLVQETSKHKAKKQKKHSKKADLSAVEITKASHQLNYFSVIAVVLCTALVLSIFPQSSYIRDPNLDNVKATVQNLSIQDINPFNFLQTGGISGGDLKSAGDISFTGETALKIKTSNTYQMYLRGYAGITYTGSRWEEMPDEIYNLNRSKFDKLNDKDFNPQNLYSTYMDLMKKSYDNFSNEGYGVSHEYQTYSMEVQNVHANKKFVYAPYELITKPEELPGAIFDNDEYIKSSSLFGLNDYSLKAYQLRNFSSDMANGADVQQYYKRYTPGSVRIYGVASWERQFYNLEYAYRSTMYDYTTGVPKELRDKILKMCEENNLITGDLNTEISAVRNYLAKSCRYTLSPGSTPKGRDFVDYFLFENHKGYCTHFASAAALIFRSLGIPCRYVEGYVVNHDDLMNKDSDGYVSIEDRRAHAWVEVYSVYYGWLPVEMTPGFSSNDGTLAPKAGDIIPIQPDIPSSAPASSSEIDSESELSSADNSSVSSQSGLSSTSSGSSGRLSSKDILNNPYTPYVILLIVLIALAAFLFGSRRHSLNWRRKNFHLQNTNQSALNIYAYLLKLFAFFGKPYTHDFSPTAYAKEMQQSCKFLNGNDFETVTRIAQRARFSQHKISDKELQFMNTFTRGLADTCYQELPWYKKLLFRYWYRLY